MYNRIGAALLCLMLALTSVMPALAAGKTTASAASSSATEANVSQTMTVTYLDVGQGDATIIQCGDKTLMIDGGSTEYLDIVYSWLKEHGITRIDYMIATHPDADHIGGLTGALWVADVGTCYCPTTTGDNKSFANLVKYLKKRGKKITVPTPGTRFALNNAAVEILGPLTQSESQADTSLNDNSIVAKVTFGKTTFLFAGDAEYEEETELIAADADLSSDVLKVGHHGSSSSTCDAFLQAVSPTYAVISVGADNDYGHPTRRTLNRLKKAGVTTYRTDMQGTITAVSDGEQITFAVEHNVDVDTYSNPGAISSRTAAASTEQTTYVINTKPTSMKFHYEYCKYAKQIDKENRLEVHWTRDVVIAAGYKACKVCKP